jgi:hypothetical protein
MIGCIKASYQNIYLISHFLHLAKVSIYWHSRRILNIWQADAIQDQCYDHYLLRIKKESPLMTIL